MEKLFEPPISDERPERPTTDALREPAKKLFEDLAFRYDDDFDAFFSVLHEGYSYYADAERIYSELCDNDMVEELDEDAFVEDSSEYEEDIVSALEDYQKASYAAYLQTIEEWFNLKNIRLLPKGTLVQTDKGRGVIVSKSNRYDYMILSESGANLFRYCEGITQEIAHKRWKTLKNPEYPFLGTLQLDPELNTLQILDFFFKNDLSQYFLAEKKISEETEWFELIPESHD